MSDANREAIRLIHGMASRSAGRPTVEGDIFKIADAALNAEPKLQASRELVYQCIDGERYFQEEQTLRPDRPDMIPNLSVGDHILAMEENLQRARVAWYSGSSPHHAALDFLRKVTALGVRCMENNGVVHRKGM
jgi:hypothetical protein